MKQLYAEKKRLEQRKLELEKAIRYDWRDVKESLKPKHFAGQVFSKLFEESTVNGEHPLAAGLSQLAATLTKIAVEKAEEKVEEWLKKK
jgi:hypothetical protein